MKPLGLTLEELALAYELRQEGCCWRRISVGLNCDHRALQQAVTSIARRGIRKGTNGYARQPGRPASYSLEAIRAAHAKRQKGMTWPQIAAVFGGTANAMRLATKHAIDKGLI